MGRTPLSVRVSWARRPTALLGVSVRFAADCGPAGQALTVLRLVCPRGEVQPLKSRRLASAASAANWRNCVSPGKMTIGPAEGGGVLIDAVMKPGDRWTYPILRPAADDLPKEDWDGLAFTVVPLAGQADFKAIFDKANGSSYVASADIGPTLQMGKAYRVVVFFRECAWGGFSKPDPDNKLGLDQIRTMKLGCNTKEEHVRFILRDVAWVKYAP
jgi:hypothetical protein